MTVTPFEARTKLSEPVLDLTLCYGPPGTCRAKHLGKTRCAALRSAAGSVRPCHRGPGRSNSGFP